MFEQLSMNTLLAAPIIRCYGRETLFPHPILCEGGRWVTMEEEQAFYTQKGYEMRSGQTVTSAMEDYLEMICRQARTEGYARINFLAQRLNVRPSSASKMVYQLRDLGLVAFEKSRLISTPYFRQPQNLPVIVDFLQSSCCRSVSAALLVHVRLEPGHRKPNRLTTHQLLLRFHKRLIDHLTHAVIQIDLPLGQTRFLLYRLLIAIQCSKRGKLRRPVLHRHPCMAQGKWVRMTEDIAVAALGVTFLPF